MDFDFELLLTVLVIVSGLITAFDLIFLNKSRREKFIASQIHKEETEKEKLKLPWLIDYSRSFFPILLLVLIIRSFVIQPFRVPTGSLEPTVLPGDFIAVNQYAYGLRLPVLHTKIFDVGEPERGDIAVFRYPPDPGINYVKRVVGVPGDTISYINKVLYINGKKMEQTTIGPNLDIEPEIPIPVIEKQEDLTGVKHPIFLTPNRNEGPNSNYYNIKVPEGYYFMMGDNRDNSLDSRVWGFVPEKNLIGKAFFVWLSWDGINNNFRWDHLGKLH